MLPHVRSNNKNGDRICQGARCGEWLILIKCCASFRARSIAKATHGPPVRRHGGPPYFCAFNKSRESLLPAYVAPRCVLVVIVVRFCLTLHLEVGRTQARSPAFAVTLASLIDKRKFWPIGWLADSRKNYQYAKNSLPFSNVTSSKCQIHPIQIYAQFRRNVLRREGRGSSFSP